MKNDSIVAIDFETYYDKEYSLKKLPVSLYVKDERFDPYLVSMASESVRYSGPLENAPWQQITGKTWIAHNANFDLQVCERATSLGLIPEWASPKQWHCTADLSVYRQAPRNLKGAAYTFLGMDLDKDVRDQMSCRQYRSLNKEEKTLWHNYAMGDSDAALGIWNDQSSYWPESERRLSSQTSRIGRKGVAVNTQLIDWGITHLKTTLWEAEKLIPWADTEAKTLSAKALAEACRLEGIPAPASTAQNSPECERWEECYGKEYPWVSAMRDYRKANKTLRVLETIKKRTSEDGIMPFSMKYCGAAATGRWSGDSGLNLQNLPRDESYGVNIRKCFIARPGKKFVISDLRQIEPIVLAWLIGDESFLAHVKAGRDTYEAHARASMNYTDPRPLKQVDKTLRSLAKARVLGLSYGASYEPFIRIAKQMAALELNPVEAKRAVVDFRLSNPLITGLWQRLDHAFKLSRNQTYTLELPSGREVRYFDVSPRGWTARVTQGQTPRRFWGSKLVENLIQAIARDVFGECLLRLEDAGFDVVWHVHDEAIVEVDQHDRQALPEVVRLMSMAPDWAPGLPVSADAIESTHYTK